MPIVDQTRWEIYVSKNTDEYGKTCIDVARRAMEILDAESGEIYPHAIIHRSSEEVETGGITGFMAGCVAMMISECHSRGQEFRERWNLSTQIGEEGVRANEKGTMLDPALLEFSE